MENFVPWANGYSIQEIQSMQKSDSDIEPIHMWKQEGKLPSGETLTKSSMAVRHYALCWEALEIKHGILFRKYDKRNGTGSFLQMVVPRSLRNDVLHQMHNSILSGHLGQKKTREKVLQKYYWFGIREDINLWILQCENCGANKTPTMNPKAPMGHITSGAPLDKLCTDLLGPFPMTPRKNKYILVVTDHFTKWVEIFAVPDQSAETTARVILNEVLARYGTPISIHSDKGAKLRKQNISGVMQHVRNTEN